MKKLIIQSYPDIELVITSQGIETSPTNNGEVLSGVTSTPPPTTTTTTSTTTTTTTTPHPTTTTSTTTTTTTTPHPTTPKPAVNSPLDLVGMPQTNQETTGGLEGFWKGNIKFPVNF